MTPLNVIRVKNWEEYQHYHYRNPPWIKLYRHLLDDYTFMSLTESERWLFIGLLMLASETDNRIPNDAKWIRNRLLITNKRTSIESLIAVQLIERVASDSENASKPLASREQNAISEAEQETESRARGRDRAAAAAEPANSAAAAASKHSREIIERFVRATKPHSTNPGGLAVRLHRTGEEDDRVTAWLAEEKKRGQAAEQRARSERDQTASDALEWAHRIIGNGGPDERDQLLNTTTLELCLHVLQPRADEINSQAGTRTSFDSEILNVVGQLAAYKDKQPAIRRVK